MMRGGIASAGVSVFDYGLDKIFSTVGGKDSWFRVPPSFPDHDTATIFRPNALEAMGIGFAAGLPSLDIRARLAIGVGSWLVGRVLNLESHKS